MKKHNSLSQCGDEELGNPSSLCETYQDATIAPDALMAIRVVAQGAEALEPLCIDYPYDKRTTKAFLLTAQDVMSSYSKSLLAYAHRDEITFVMSNKGSHPDLTRSVLVSEVSSRAALAFSRYSGIQVPFHARIIQFTSDTDLLDYLFWRRHECYRRSLADACHRALQRSGHTDAYISSRIKIASEREQLALLEDLGSPITTTPHTTRRGSLLSWRSEPNGDSVGLKINFNTTIPDRDDHFKGLLLQHLTTHTSGDMPKRIVPAAQTTRAPAKPFRTHRSFLPLRNKKVHVSVVKAVPHHCVGGGPDI